MAVLPRVALGASVGVLVLARALGPLAAAGPVLCPIRLATGFPCPGCGLIRAFACMAQGQVGDALAFNALGVPMFVGLVGFSLVLAGQLLLRRRPTVLELAVPPVLLRATLGAVAAYHLVRVAWMWRQGTLVSEYLADAWWYRTGELLGGGGG